MYIVTGASGHIGHQVCTTLLKQGFEVKVLARHPLQHFNCQAVTVVLGKLSDSEFLKHEIHSGDIVIHCVGKIDLFNDDYDASFEANVNTTMAITDCCLEKRARLIYISTADIIEKEPTGWIEEPVTFKSLSTQAHYGYTKKEATLYVRKAIKNGLSGVILYPTAVIGINDYKQGPITTQIKRAVQQKVLFSVHGGYNFIDVEDLSKAIIQSAYLPYNDEFILSGSNLSITDLYKRIRKYTKKPKVIIHVPLWVVRLIIRFSKQYSPKMIEVIQGNHKYSNAKMKKYLISELKPFDLTLAETIRFIQTQA